ncbi:hypothetical protein F0P96_19805 [Hymenobacter busanensis]|uniref:Uncharacterized protein n=1 Tax=Hymenobacter busanensis TaxID=2607656 RepID=A0A7L4ZXV1_9BACT|nr:hypothetical protein [Hymenobacter busanensis]KAA9325575.1 hypothetical protein F0P96_19805 [Hymenobacter busanensis]QHJ07753.1 hypothetical protein GUY19_10860 [Hymenobacter busanensis]
MTTPKEQAAYNPRTPAAQTSPKQEQPYRLLGVIDPDMNNTVAFALKVPRDWEVKQSFKRKWNGAIPSPQIYLSFRSPDGTQQIEYLPANEYTYSEGPMADNMRAQMQSMGIPNTNPGELQPRSALAYIKQVLLPELAQRGMRLRDVGNETELPDQPAANQVVKSSAYVDGVLANGRKARVECRMQLQTVRSNGETYYAWQVVPSITQTSGELAASYAHTKAAQESITMNPTWQQLNNDVVQRGMKANSDANDQNLADQRRWAEIQQRGHDQRMADIQRSGAANTAAFNDRMNQMDQQHNAYMDRSRSQDRQHEYAVDAIREKEKYADPTTGERVKVDAGYNHVYTDRQGNYYGSNTPVKATDVNWQELQRVALKDY